MSNRKYPIIICFQIPLGCGGMLSIMKYLGNIINYERKKRKISLERLSAGILTPTGLKRLEDGERIPSFFVFERIMERLGKSTNKLEFLLHEKEYEIYYLREKIERALEQGNLEEVGKSISYYETLPLANEALHYQYLCKVKAVFYKMKGDESRSGSLLEEALKVSLCWWEDNRIQEAGFLPEDIFKKYPMGKEEISLLLLWMQQMWQEGKEIKIEGRKLLSVLSQYYEEEEEERANLFSKVCWVLGTLSLEEENEEEALFFTRTGQQVLADNKLLLHMPQYLDRLVMIGEKTGHKETEEWRKQRDALKEVFYTYEKLWDMREIPLWKNHKTQVIYLISEVVEKERKIRKKTQQEIAFDLEMDPKTISRLEGGIYKPKVETFEKLKAYYQISTDLCSSRIITEDFSLLEIERKVAQMEHLNRMEEAEMLYLRLRDKLDTRWKKNRQYILYKNVLFDHQLGRICHEEALEGCREAFQVTRPYLAPESADQIILSHNECLIINYMGICHRKMGQREKTISLLEKAIKGYRSSKVDSKHYFYSLGLLYLNLIDNYEENDQFEKALLLCEEAIHYEIDANKCSDLGYLISQKQYTIDRKTDTVTEEGKKYYYQGFQLMKLAKRESVISDLKKGYRKWYGEELE